MFTCRWWQQWLDYVNQDQANNMNDISSLSEHCDSVSSSDVKRPSVIDNSDLIYDTTSEDATMGIELHDTLVEGRDYILLPQEVWNQLYAWWVSMEMCNLCDVTILFHFLDCNYIFLKNLLSFFKLLTQNGYFL